MKRGKPLKRTPFKVGPPTLDKLRARRKFVAEWKKRHPTCQVCWCLPMRDVHEPWSRGRGGPVNDERNSVSICRACHDWIHRNKLEADAMGLLIPAHEGPKWLEAGGVQR